METAPGLGPELGLEILRRAHRQPCSGSCHEDSRVEDLVKSSRPRAPPRRGSLSSWATSCTLCDSNWSHGHTNQGKVARSLKGFGDSCCVWQIPLPTDTPLVTASLKLVLIPGTGLSPSSTPCETGHETLRSGPAGGALERPRVPGESCRPG